MYKIPVEGKKVKKHQVTTIHLMSGILLLVMGLVTWAVPNQFKASDSNLLNTIGLLYSLAGLCLLIICVFFNKKVIQSKANYVLRLLEILLFTPILIYALLQEWYLPAAYSGVALLGIILAYYWEKRGDSIQWVTIDETGIKLPRTGINIHLKWQELQQVLLRHKILTIDCNDNRLYQFHIHDAHPDIPAQQALESYCSQHISTKKPVSEEEW